MVTALQELNSEIASELAQVRRSLVQVASGRRGAGAGIICHRNGLIVTNAHVVGRDPLRVTLYDGTTLPAKLLAHDPDLDLAALTVDVTDLPAIELGDSRNLKPGEWVLAMGHPWGVQGAATGGVVIGVGSGWPFPEGKGWPEIPRSHREWIMVSLPLRPGNSGGPLIDAEGRLVGINTMMSGPEIGMAVPVNMVKGFLRRVLG